MINAQARCLCHQGYGWMEIMHKNVFPRCRKQFFLWFGAYLFLVLLTTGDLCAHGLTLDEVLKLGMQANPEIHSLEDVLC